MLDVPALGKVEFPDVSEVLAYRWIHIRLSWSLKRRMGALDIIVEGRRVNLRVVWWYGM